MATTFADLLTARDKLRTESNQCSCPVCTGLDCLQHPRFFAGQVISETDLNGEVDYILAKQRLHNRYLHGVGTVCGLEVVCNECDGYVTVKPGYAISPCGDDIIVCQEQPFNVIKAINDCCTSRKKKSVCDPYQPATDPGCTGLEQHWCITIRYRETPTQPITPLRAPQKACPCCGGYGNSCGCGGSHRSGNGNGNGNGKNGSACGCGSSSSTATTTASTPAQCEPTRVLEGYELGVVPDPGNCRDWKTALSNTLFGNLLGCFNELTGAGTKLPAKSVQIIGLAVANTLPNSQTNNSDAYAACCQFRQYVLEVVAQGGYVTHCAALKAFEGLSCPAPPTQETGASNPQYLGTVQTSIQLTAKALITAYLECVCHELLPPCSPDPTDDRLILACLTVKDGEIIDICNFACRRFAGSFPSFFYWLSLVPIAQLIRRFVEELCCGAVEPQAIRGREIMSSNNKDFTHVQRTMMESNFALPKMLLDQVGDLAQKFSVAGLAGSIPTGQLNLATVRGMSLSDAESALKAHGVSYQTEAVNTRAEIPLSIRAFFPFAKQGDHVVLYQSGNTVLEVHPTAAVAERAQPQAAADVRSEMESLRAEIDKLKKTVASLKKK